MISKPNIRAMIIRNENHSMKQVEDQVGWSVRWKKYFLKTPLLEFGYAVE
jgi:hypothetical protein